MSVIRRSRSLARRGLKVQRRVALAQLLFWPALIGTAAAAGLATVISLRRTGDDGPRHGV
ncbi:MULTISPECIES: hypothetical protein [Mycolicibacterium]|uniref:Uncharacterized protein n=1 Tax=Mycolicibacterium gilvum TaxID=1804 RepID=A0A378SMT8_9MYCO|nr:MULTISPECIES: hypothetical protein [Mycolicibacterium]MBV5243925.1 hypothetical protein [Mycolicibacterium sp. PAM1]MCV7053632.1 hypothetical protein [Mycolicibacterium gilvum]STZ43226.1 Uncharacterised protein [Mycolicibacterium gilvum]